MSTACATVTGVQFQKFPKIARLNRECVITEKIDGTNAAIVITRATLGTCLLYADYRGPDGLMSDDYDPSLLKVILDDSEIGEDELPEYEFHVRAQSRNRMLTTAADNFGFAKWVQANAQRIIYALGEGVHYGEWWGSGIQRGYGLTKGDRRFSLFNVARYEGVNLFDVPGLGVVPTCFRGPFSTHTVDYVVQALARQGSLAVAHYSQPEGVVIYHEASRTMFKVTVENDEKPKGVSQ